MSDIQTRVGIVPEVRGAPAAVSEIASVYQALRSGTMNVKDANAALKDYGGTIRAQSSALRLMRSEFRNTHAALMESMRAISSVASIGRTLTSIYQTYTLSQIRIADKTRDVRDVEEELNKVQTLRSQVVKDLGVDSVYALRLMDEEDQLTKRLTDEKIDLSRAQKENAAGYVSMGLSALQVIPSLVYIYQHTQAARDLLGDASWRAETLNTISTSALAAKTALSLTLAEWGILAGALAAPLVATIIVKTVKESEYYAELPEEEQGYTPGTKGYFDWEKWFKDTFGGEEFGGGGGFGGGGAGLREGGVDVTVGGDTDVDVTVKTDVTVEKKGGGSGGKFR